MKDSWKIIPFEDVCLSMTKGPFGSDIKKSLYVPKSESTYKVYIQANAIEKDPAIGDYYISKEYFDTKMFRFEVKPGDYIITCDGTLGKFIRLPQTIERGIISASLLRITLGDQIVPRYFEYLWDGYILSRLTKDIRNSALVHLPSATKIGKVLIPVPSISEQERIVAELDLLTGIIDKQKAQLKELDTLAQSIFYDMFGDPVENEKGWNIKKLSEIAEGKLSYGSGSSSTPFNGNIRYIRITDIDDNGCLKDEIVSPSDFNSKYLLNDGDILFARSGATVGKTYRHRSSNGKCIYAGYLIRLIPKLEIVNPEYVFGFTKTHYYKSFIALSQKAVAQPNINAEQYGNLSICVPPLSLQQSFAQKIQSIESQKDSINRSIAETQKLFDYTMDKYFE